MSIERLKERCPVLLQLMATSLLLLGMVSSNVIKTMPSVTEVVKATLPPSVDSKKQCPPERPKTPTPVGIFCGRQEVVHWPDGVASKVDIYHGIRYAQPPISGLRFRKPVPPNAQPETVFMADQPPNACPQLNDTIFSDLVIAYMWFVNTPINEDCLFLNIFVPSPKQPDKESMELLPVMVWIYGGSFYTGSGSLSVYDGRYLAARQNVIVVTLNYRIGPFGFLYAGTEEAPGNMGLWDQRLAIKWVKDNIRSFGGDPDRITLFGESAGSVSISAHVVSPWSHSFFTNAIMQSGSVFCSWGLQNSQQMLEKTNQYARILDCDYKSKKLQIDCLREKTVQELLEAHNEMFDQTNYFDIPFPPVLDNQFLPYEDYGKFQRLHFLKPSGSLMLGINKNEGSYFLLYAFLNRSLWHGKDTRLPIRDMSDYRQLLRRVLNLSVKDNSTTTDYLVHYTEFEYKDYDNMPSRDTWTERLENISSDHSFKCPTITMATTVTDPSRLSRSVRAPTLPVYFYEFQHKTGSLPTPDWMGTMHGYEIEYVFGIPFSPKFQSAYYGFTEEERRLSDLMMTYWANFARTGDPNILPGGKHVLDLNTPVLGDRQPERPELESENGAVAVSADEQQGVNEQEVLNYLTEHKLPTSLRRCQFAGWPEFVGTTQHYLAFSRAPGHLQVKSSPRRRQCLYWVHWYPALVRHAKELRLRCEKQS